MPKKEERDEWFEGWVIGQDPLDDLIDETGRLDDLSASEQQRRDAFLLSLVDGRFMRTGVPMAVWRNLDDGEVKRR